MLGNQRIIDVEPMLAHRRERLKNNKLALSDCLVFAERAGDEPF